MARLIEYDCRPFGNREFDFVEVSIVRLGSITKRFIPVPRGRAPLVSTKNRDLWEGPSDQKELGPWRRECELSIRYAHSRPQSPRSFWPVVGIESSGQTDTRAKRLRMRRVSIFKLAVANANFTTRMPVFEQKSNLISIQNFKAGNVKPPGMHWSKDF